MSDDRWFAGYLGLCGICGHIVFRREAATPNDPDAAELAGWVDESGGVHSLPRPLPGGAARERGGGRCGGAAMREGQARLVQAHRFRLINRLRPRAAAAEGQATIPDAPEPGAYRQARAVAPPAPGEMTVEQAIRRGRDELAPAPDEDGPPPELFRGWSVSGDWRPVDDIPAPGFAALLAAYARATVGRESARIAFDAACRRSTVAFEAVVRSARASGIVVADHREAFDRLVEQARRVGEGGNDGA